MFDKDNKFGFISNNNESNNNIEGLDNVKTDINNIKSDLGNEELTTVNKDVKGAINEVNAQYKESGKNFNEGFQNSLLKFPRLIGENNDNNRILRALELNNSVVFPAGEYIVNNLELPIKNVKLIANGTVVIKNSDLLTPCFTSSSENCIEIRGFSFTNTKYGIFLKRNTSSSIKYNFNINNCSFINIIENDGYSIYLDGLGQGSITNCNFTNSNGIYRVRTINTIIDSCVFHTGKYAINDDGDFTSYSCGITLNNIQILGYEYGIILKGCDNFVVSNCMIDYNDNSIIIDSAYTGKIHSSYISTRTNNPTVKLISGTNDEAIKEIKIYGNDILANNDSASLIEFTGNKNIEAITISDNNLTFFSKYAIENNLDDGKALILSTIDKNFIANRTGYGICAILTGSTDSSTRVTNNNFSLGTGVNVLDKKVGVNLTFSNNRGYKSKNKGIGIITTGQTSITINHDIQHSNELRVQVSTNNFVGTKISNVNDVSFTVEIDKATDSDVKVFWSAEDIFNL